MDSAYEDNVPWIKKLVLFVRNLIENHLRVKLAGEFSSCPLAGKVPHQASASGIRSSVVHWVVTAYELNNSKLARH